MKSKINIGKLYLTFGYTVWIIGAFVMYQLYRKLPDALLNFDVRNYYLENFKPYSLSVNILVFLLFLLITYFVIKNGEGLNVSKFQVYPLILAILVPIILPILKLYNTRIAISKGSEYYLFYSFTNNIYEKYLAPISNIFFIFAFYLLLAGFGFLFGRSETYYKDQEKRKNRILNAGIIMLFIHLILSIIVLFKQTEIITFLFLPNENFDASMKYIPEIVYVLLLIIFCCILSFSLFSYNEKGGRLNSYACSILLGFFIIAAFMLKNAISIYSYVFTDTEEINYINGIYNLNGLNSELEYAYHNCLDGLFGLINVFLEIGLGLLLFGLFKKIGRSSNK